METLPDTTNIDIVERRREITENRYVNTIVHVHRQNERLGTTAGPVEMVWSSIVARFLTHKRMWNGVSLTSTAETYIG